MMHFAWKFDLNSKLFSMWHKYPKHESVLFRFHSSALNEDRTKLYIFGDPGFVVTVDLMTGKFNKSEKFHDGAYCVSSSVNLENKAHYIWSEIKWKMS